VVELFSRAEVSTRPTIGNPPRLLDAVENSPAAAGTFLVKRLPAMKDENIKITPIGEIREIQGERKGKRLLFIEIYPEFRNGLTGIKAGHELQVLYWMDRLGEEERKLLLEHPMGDRSRPRRGVFSLRSPARPNPIGSSIVRVVEATGSGLVVEGLDALVGSPVIDIKGVRA